MDPSPPPSQPPSPPPRAQTGPAGERSARISFVSCSGPLHLLRLLHLIQNHVRHRLPPAFLQDQEHFSAAPGFEATLDLDQVLSPRTAAGSVAAGCRNAHDVDVVNLGQIDVFADIGRPEAKESKRAAPDGLHLFHFQVVGPPIAGETFPVAIRKEYSLLAFPESLDPFVVAFPPRQILEVVPEHEAIPHHADTHFLEVAVAQEWGQPPRDLVRLNVFEVGAEAPLPEIQAELVRVPGVVVGQGVVVPAPIGHGPIATKIGSRFRHRFGRRVCSVLPLPIANGGMLRGGGAENTTKTTTTSLSPILRSV
ncbi:unnamed protein product [Pseudo-nitzschia multistriata]|uniref:Uncharacterized protein n=1 Tax=Pseudo-nitzschia multistriata TaxID=183589 RepID=A0A448ZCJ1_9STRA|nr:unnamed protein product [Pseudo-nitzschia multistriata]